METQYSAVDLYLFKVGRQEKWWFGAAYYKRIEAVEVGTRYYDMVGTDA
jgi:hypothetical protein